MTATLLTRSAASRIDAPPGRPCPVCAAEAGQPILEVDDLPVSSRVLCTSPDEARGVPRASVRLVFCERCCHVHNDRYRASLVEPVSGPVGAPHVSAVLNDHLQTVARRLIDTYDLVDREVCSLGDEPDAYVQRLCELGARRGRDQAASDLVCCRQVLEDLPRPLEPLRRWRRILDSRDDAVAFFEVPNGFTMLERGGLWDVAYEHCSYFTPMSLRHLIQRAGFSSLAERVEHEGRYLTLEAAPGEVVLSSPGTDDALRQLVADGAASFGEACRDKLERWSHGLQRLAHDGRRLALWGAGASGATFLNLLGVDTRTVACVVDVRPERHGRFVAGTGHPVVAPADLTAAPPDAVIVLGALAENEIRDELAILGLEADLLIA